MHLWKLFYATYALSRHAGRSTLVSVRAGIKVVLAKMRGQIPSE